MIREEGKVYCCDCKWRGLLARIGFPWPWCEVKDKFTGSTPAIEKIEKNKLGLCADFVPQLFYRRFYRRAHVKE